MSPSFRWLGVAGIELRAGEQVLAIDPFLTRPSLTGVIKPVLPNTKLVKEKIPYCDGILVTHSHWDHLMDVSTVLQHTGAVAYGSSNTCQLLHLLGVPGTQVKEIHVGDTLALGTYKVEVIHGQHSWIPLSRWFNGRLRTGLQPPLRLQDYRMDIPLGYCIEVGGLRMLVCAAQPQPAEILFTVAQESKAYYRNLFSKVQPLVVVPIHWDNFFRPLSKPLHQFTRPGRMQLRQLADLVGKLLPDASVIIPDLFREYTFNLSTPGFINNGNL
jgi:L-ascorbate metabolism protein UlaG (beta-lactamase superfamily)